MTINGWSESQDDAAIRWEKTQAVWYAAEQLNASEITDIEAIELEAALRNAALLDAETVTEMMDWMTEVIAQMADAKDLQETQENARL